MRQSITLFAILLTLFCHQALAQERTITGKVISSQDNLGIPGASIVVSGTTVGTVTDVDGNYKLVLPKDAKAIKISSVGLVTKEIMLTAENNYDATLEPDVLKLDEVVVTAIGISRDKKALGYSTQTVKGDDVNTLKTGNAVSELGGKVSGLTVINSSGDAGAGTYVRLRGVTSLTGNNQPLFVVDGVPIDNSINNYDPTFSQFQASGANGNTTGGVSPDNRAMDINPSDIASITVLKGPAATALYGINAASGAIIITTKKGGAGAGRGPIVNFTTSTTWDQVNKLPKLQDQWGQGSGGIYSGPNSGNSGRRLTWGPNISTLSWDGQSNEWDPNGNIVNNSDPSAVKAVTAYDPTDFFQTGTTVNNEFSVGGGSEISGYRMSIGNVHQKGTIPLTKYDKTTFSLSGQHNFTSKFKASASVSYVKSKSSRAQQGSNVSGVMLGLLRTPPTFDNSYGLSDAANNPSSYVLADGSQRNYRGGPGYDNPYWTVNRNPYDQNLDRVYGNTQLDYQLMPWLTATYRIGGDVYTQQTKNGYDIHSNAFPEGAIYNVNYYNSQFNSDFILHATHRFNDDFNGDLVVGHNYFTNTGKNNLASGNGFSVPTFFSLQNATSYLSSESTAKKRTQAFYAAAQIDWKSQIFLTLTGRQETSSTLPADDNKFFYPSASVGWVFTETFGMSDNKVLPYGKLRVSYASVGKDAPVQALQTYYVPSTVNDGFTSGNTWPYGGYAGYSISNTTNTIGNPALKPENTTAFEIGADLTFFQNLFNLSATYYHSKTTDQIFTVPTSYAIGWPAAILNAGDITNNGFELSLNATPVSTKSGLTWDVTLNWSTNKNVVNELYPGVDNLFIAGFENGGVYAVKGKSAGVIYGSRYERVDPSDMSSPYLIDDDPSSPSYGMPIPGEQNDVLGDIYPDWIGSFLSKLSYKGFTLGFQIDIRQGGDIWNGTRGALSYFGTSEETANRGETKTFEGKFGHMNADGKVVHYDTDGVTEIDGVGGSNDHSVVLDQFYWQNIGSSFVGPTEPSIEDGSFVRFRQLSLGYSFPKAMISKLKLQNLSVTVFANNPFLWTDYTGVDPETGLGGPNNGQGLDYFNNPGTKSFGFSVNVGL